MSNDRGVEDQVLGIMGKALTLGAGGVSVHETGSKRALDPFRMRCHAALPVWIVRSERKQDQESCATTTYASLSIPHLDRLCWQPHLLDRKD